MYAIYGNIYHQYTPVLLASIYHTYGSYWYMGCIFHKCGINVLYRWAVVTHFTYVGLSGQNFFVTKLKQVATYQSEDHGEHRLHFQDMDVF